MRSKEYRASAKPYANTDHTDFSCSAKLPPASERGCPDAAIPPQRSIDELGPAVYSEQRHIPVQCLRKQGVLQFIAPGAQLAISGVGVFLVQGRIHIIATREQNAIAFLCHKSGIGRRKWKNNGQRVANRKSLEIARYHPYAFTCIVVQRSNAYQTRPQTAQRH